MHVKYSEDIINEGVKLTCERIKDCISNFHKFKTEKEVKNFLNEGFEIAFDTMVASGKNASSPHYFGNDVLNKGFCIIDFGIKHKGFCTDITRMVYIGNPSDKEIKLYNYILKEHNKILKMIKCGSDLKYIEKLFRKRIGDKSKLFTHLLGHGLGEEVHAYKLGIANKNDVFTIEPGIYDKGKYGLRIEDMVYIDNEGNKKVLTDSLSKELIVINA